MNPIATLHSAIQNDRSKQKELIENFLDTHRFPLIAPQQATFFYWSMDLVDAVFIKHAIHGLETQQEMERISGTNAFWLTINLPDEARIEYQYILRKGGTDLLTTDPHNPNSVERIHVEQGSHQSNASHQEKSVCTMAGYQTPEWTQPNDNFRPGTIEHIEFFSEIFSDTRTMEIYLPNEHQEHKRYPLLICLDGEDYCSYSGMRTVLDNLMGANEMLPTIVVFINATDRNREFAANPLYAQFLSTEVLKHIEGRYNIHKSPDQRAIMGVGLGAIAALYTTWRHPHVFEKVLLQSGRFLFTDIGDHGLGDDWSPMVNFVNSIRETPVLPKSIYLSCGVFDEMIYYNRTMAHIWEREPVHFRYVESKDGHNWLAWRDRLREGLTWIFPGHLRMIYN